MTDFRPAFLPFTLARCTFRSTFLPFALACCTSRFNVRDAFPLRIEKETDCLRNDLGGVVNDMVFEEVDFYISGRYPPSSLSSPSQSRPLHPHSPPPPPPHSPRPISCPALHMPVHVSARLATWQLCERADYLLIIIIIIIVIVVVVVIIIIVCNAFLVHEIPDLFCA